MRGRSGGITLRISNGHYVVCFEFEKMAGTLKQTTYIAGLAVCKNPQNILKRIYSRTLKILLKMPEGSTYRKATQDIVNNRLAIVSSTSDVKDMEEKIGCGQIEEVIRQARNELELAEKFLLLRPWEGLKTPIPKNQWKWPIK